MNLVLSRGLVKESAIMLSVGTRNICTFDARSVREKNSQARKRAGWAITCGYHLSEKRELVLRQQTPPNSERIDQATMPEAQTH